IQAKSRALAVVETMNGGNPTKESRDIDIPLSAAHFFHYAGWADKLEYAFPNRNVAPLGVAAQANPRNIPPVPAAWTPAPAAAAGTKKKLTLELGGKAPNIIFEDAPLDQAIEGIINGIYFNRGHVCCAGSRLFVQESVVEPIIRKLRDRIGTLRVGNPLDKNTD